MPTILLDEDDRNLNSTLPAAPSDPPPPYPSPRRHGARRSNRRQAHYSIQTGNISSTDSHSEDAQLSPLTPDEGSHLLPPTPRSTTRRLRPRSNSHTSTISVAPSLAQTVLSLFQPVEESDLYDDFEEGRMLLSPAEDEQRGPWSYAAWERYFRPMGQKVYYRSLFHLAVINFPYALAAWVYLFVLTVVRALYYFCWLSNGMYIDWDYAARSSSSWGHSLLLQSAGGQDLCPWRSA